MSNYVTLEKVRRGYVPITPMHLQNLKELLLLYVRADWKKQRIKHLTTVDLTILKPLYSFVRVLFYPSGKVEYVAGQDFNYEIKEVITAIIGKR